MSMAQRKLLPVLGFIASVIAVDCPACYTHTVAGLRHCPNIPARTAPCVEPQCIISHTTTIPGPNPACPNTPTVTTYAPCPTTVTCRKGCATSIKTTTGPAAACGVSWETGAPAIPASISWDTGNHPGKGYSISWETDSSAPEATVSWDSGEPSNPGYSVSWQTDSPGTQLTGPGYSVSWQTDSPGTRLTGPGYSVSWETGSPENTGGVSWATGTSENTGGVIWATGTAENTGGVSWATQAPEPTGVSWATQAAENTGDVSWQTEAPQTTGGVIWGKDKRVAQDGGPSDSFGFGTDPAVTISWGKERREPQKNSIGFQWPSGFSISWAHHRPTSSAYVSWGKRDPQDLTFGGPTDSYGFHWPTDLPSISFENPQPSVTTSTSSIAEYISWGKRDPQDLTFGGPTDSYGLHWPTDLPSISFNIPQPTQPAPSKGGYMSWGKRGAQPQPEPTAPAILAQREEAKASVCTLTTTVTRPVPCPLIACPNGPPIVCPIDEGHQRAADPELAFPSSVEAIGKESGCPITVTTKGKCPSCGGCTGIGAPTPVPMPTLTTAPSLSRKPSSSYGDLCPISTIYVSPPCIPPVCPHRQVACAVAAAEEGEVQSVVEKTIVTIKTFTPSGSPTVISDPGCTVTPTTTVYLGCPTYTCVPWSKCDEAHVVR